LTFQQLIFSPIPIAAPHLDDSRATMSVGLCRQTESVIANEAYRLCVGVQGDLPPFGSCHGFGLGHSHLHEHERLRSAHGVAWFV
jgi:hypothetical protein